MLVYVMHFCNCVAHAQVLKDSLLGMLVTVCIYIYIYNFRMIVTTKTSNSRGPPYKPTQLCHEAGFGEAANQRRG